MLTRLRTLRDDESGSLALSLGFTLVCAVFSMLFVQAVTTSVGVSNDARAVTAMNTAVDDRFTSYVTSLNNGETGIEGKRCYELARTCVDLQTKPSADGTVTAVLVATYQGGERSLEQTRFLDKQNGTHITGFDNTGAPVWGSATANIGTRFKTVTGDEVRTCALDTGDKAVCWGEGPIGDGTPDSRLSPTPVAGDRVYTHLAMSGGSICATEPSGTVLCWGANPAGRLGTGDTTTPAILTPTAVPGVQLSSITASNGAFCGRDASEVAWCWGDKFGTTPTIQAGGQPFTELTLVGSTVTGTTAAGALLSWTATAPAPVLVSGPTVLHGIVADATGARCALDSAQKAWCKPADQPAFTEVPGDHTFSSIVIDGTAFTGLREDKKLVTWSTAAGAPVPVITALDNDFTAVRSAGGKTCALDTHRAAWCWTAAAPTLTKMATPKLSSITVLGNRVHALDQRGNLISEGENAAGQLGAGNTEPQAAPVAAAVPTTPLPYKAFTGFSN